MNVTEANDFNVVLRWLMGKIPSTSHEASLCMQRLAQRSHDRLGAGFTEIDVARWWRQEIEGPAEPVVPAITHTVVISEHDDAQMVQRKIAAALVVVEHSLAWSFDVRDVTS